MSSLSISFRMFEWKKKKKRPGDAEAAHARVSRCTRGVLPQREWRGGVSPAIAIGWIYFWQFSTNRHHRHIFGKQTPSYGRRLLMRLNRILIQQFPPRSGASTPRATVTLIYYHFLWRRRVHTVGSLVSINFPRNNKFARVDDESLIAMIHLDCDVSTRESRKV